MYGDFSLNTSATNLTRGAQLANIEERYLLQRYFNNEGSFSIQTIGSTNLTLVSALAINSTSAILTFAWPYASTTAYAAFSDGETFPINLSNGSTTITWSNPLQGTPFTLTASLSAGATSATLQTAWAGTGGAFLTSFSDGETKTVTYTNGSTVISWAGGLSGNVSSIIYTSTIAASSTVNVGGVQYYKVPPNFSKLKTITITVGVLKWTLDEVLTRQEWDRLNVFPYYASIPDRFFIYDDNTIGIWPIPSATGNTLTYNYKFRRPDLSLIDATAGTVTVVNGSTAVTGAGTSWVATTNAQNESRWIQFPQPTGDNLWYQVSSVNSTTSLTLYDPYQGISIAGGTYTLGQMPLLNEDFQDMLVWKPLMFYYSTIKKDVEKYKEFSSLYAEKQKQLDEYLGSKIVNVNLSGHSSTRNPNIYPQNIG